MALAVSLATLVATLAFAIITAFFGHRVLRLCGLAFASHAEHVLCCSAVGVIFFEVLLAFSQLAGHLRVCTIAALCILLLGGAAELPAVAARISVLMQRALNAPKREKILAALTSLVLFLEGLASMAPVSGSDALHYHFTAPLEILKSGFRPDFFNSHSFFTGQGHLLILAGLSLGSSEFAMGLLFLGGALTAAAATCLARRWAGREWAWSVALTFLLTPVVFWQISVAGAPDLWMAFFATMGVLVISTSRETPVSSHAVLAGVLAGGVAGTKYTGCFVAAALAAAFLWEARSGLKTLLFLAGALAGGIYPYMRNLVWTGDPVFPFLMRWLSPTQVNSFTLASYLSDTGAATHRGLRQFIEFPFFAAIESSHAGFWQFLGPLVLAFAPLLFLIVRNTPVWRAALIVWLVGALGIGVSSAMLRFLLPVLPVTLAATIAGVSYLKPNRWRLAHFVSIATLLGFLMFGAAAFLSYIRPALAAAAGISSRNGYLRQHVQEYEKVEFINATLEGKESQGKTLVFLRHLFYLRVPFVFADPHASWAVNPDKLQTAEAWQRLFREQGIRWVVRSPEYPAEIAAPLNQLEAQGKLTPIAEAVVSDLSGLRFEGQRERASIVVLRVNQ